jgi:hypothetical protein
MVGFGEAGRRQVVIAGALVPEGTGGSPTEAICPDEVTLIRKRQPLANICSATSTANGAPTAQPTTPISTPSHSNRHISVW